MSTTPPKTGDGLKAGATAEHVIANSGAMELPLLTNTNYHEWSLVMQVSLEALELWEVVEADKAERLDDRMALAAILRAVPTDMKAGLVVKKTSNEAWAAVRTARRGDNRVKEAHVQRLLKEFKDVAPNDGETIEDLARWINGLAGNLRELGEEMEVKRVTLKKYNQIACVIEMFSDLNTATVDELVGQLPAAEDHYVDDEVAAAGAGVEHLLLTEEQCEAWRRQRGKERACGEKDGSRGGGRNEDDNDVSSSSSGVSRHRGRCFNCDERSHIARYCRQPKKEKVLLADVDDEPSL